MKHKSNIKYRDCYNELNGNCVFATNNENNEPCCSIDGIVSIELFGCRP